MIIIKSSNNNIKNCKPKKNINLTPYKGSKSKTEKSLIYLVK